MESPNGDRVEKNDEPVNLNLVVKLPSGLKYRANLQSPISIAIDLDFGGQQPSHFGAAPASANPMSAGSFVGDVRRGGSCNADEVTLNLHCNGTHTETVGHIVNEAVSIGQLAADLIVVSMLITVEPTTGAQISESYRPEIGDADQVIDSKQLLQAVSKVGDADLIRNGALMVRTLPNDAGKRTRSYSSKNPSPFFTVEAIEAINSLGVEHLLVDFPSIDRANDEGLLTNHHVFWKVPERTSALTQTTLQNKTITEMIYVDDEISDGIYGLSIQVPPFQTDSAPSRPIIMQLKPTS